MKSKQTILWGRRSRGHVLGSIAIATGMSAIAASFASGCADEDEDAVVATTYPVDADYATSVAVTDAAFADDWGAVPFSISPAIGGRDGGGVAGDGGAILVPKDAGTNAPTDGGQVSEDTLRDPIAVLHALARGSTNVCAGSVTIDPKVTRTPCGANGQPGDSQTGARLTFAGCKLAGGGEIQGGTVEISSEHTASDTACNGDTVITVNYDANVTDLSYVAPSGRKTIIKTLTDSGTYDHGLGAPPNFISSQLDARIQRIDTNGDLKSDRTFSGSTNTTLSGSPLQTTTTATLTIRNAGGNDAGSGSLNVDSLLRVSTCCHAVGGTVTTTGTQTQTVTFGPTCGDANVNGKSVSLGECP